MLMPNSFWSQSQQNCLAGHPALARKAVNATRVTRVVVIWGQNISYSARPYPEKLAHIWNLPPTHSHQMLCQGEQHQDILMEPDQLVYHAGLMDSCVCTNWSWDFASIKKCGIFGHCHQVFVISESTATHDLMKVFRSLMHFNIWFIGSIAWTNLRWDRTRVMKMLDNVVLCHARQRSWSNFVLAGRRGMFHWV